jgi:hypothetical protein
MSHRPRSNAELPALGISVCLATAMTPGAASRQKLRAAWGRQPIPSSPDPPTVCDPAAPERDLGHRRHTLSAGGTRPCKPHCASDGAAWPQDGASQTLHSRGEGSHPAGWLSSPLTGPTSRWARQARGQGGEGTASQRLLAAKTSGQGRANPSDPCAMPRARPFAGTP